MESTKSTLSPLYSNDDEVKIESTQLEKQIRCFPYIARSVVERLQATISMPINDRGISD
jgi:hypothetical protein